MSDEEPRHRGAGQKPPDERMIVGVSFMCTRADKIAIGEIAQKLNCHEGEAIRRIIRYAAGIVKKGKQ